MSITAQAVHGLKVCVIPNPENDFRPLALRHRVLAASTALLLVAKIVATSLVVLVPVSAELSTITSARIVELTNAERKKAGAPTLRVSSALTSAAAQKAQDMLAQDYFAHISPAGVTPWFWMAKAGYDYEIAGENLAIDFTEAEDVVAAWLASPSHKDNLLLPTYIETGVATATGEFQGGTSTVVVHMFGKGKQAAGTKVSAPSSSVTASPTPTPTPPPRDETPPRVPHIALTGSTEVVKNQARLTVEGEANSSVRVLVNNQTHATVRLGEDGKETVDLDISSLPEGIFVIRTYAQDNAGNESEFSQTLALTKDTLGPLIDEKALAFALTPRFDQGDVALFVPGAETSVNGRRAGWTLVGTTQVPLEITLEDQAGNTTVLRNVSFTPAFAYEQGDSELFLPARVQQFSRRLAISLAVALTILLCLTIFIRIQIQRPGLILHACFVIALATALFMI